MKLIFFCKTRFFNICHSLLNFFKNVKKATVLWPKFNMMTPGFLVGLKFGEFHGTQSTKSQFIQSMTANVAHAICLFMNRFILFFFFLKNYFYLWTACKCQEDSRRTICTQLRILYDSNIQSKTSGCKIRAILLENLLYKIYNHSL